TCALPIWPLADGPSIGGLERGRERRREAQREGERDHERDRHRQHEWPEERAGQLSEEAERDQDGDRRERRADERRRDLGGRGAERADRVLAAQPMTVEILYDDDRIVENETDRRGDASERHEVERRARAA